MLFADKTNFVDSASATDETLFAFNESMAFGETKQEHFVH